MHPVSLAHPANPVEADLTTDMPLRLLQFEASLLSHTMEKVRAELGPAATRVQS